MVLVGAQHVYYEVLIDGLRRWCPLMPSVARRLKDFARLQEKFYLIKTKW